MRLLMLALALAAGSARAAEKFEPLQINEGRFRAEAPSWPRTREKAEERKQKKYVVTLTAPADGAAAGVIIALEYYAPGNLLFKDAGQYLVQLTAPAAVKVRGKLIGKPQPIRVRREKGRHWFRESAQGEGDAKTEYVLLGAEAGFYVLTYTAPKSRFLKNRRAFQRTLDTFEPISE